MEDSTTQRIATILQAALQSIGEQKSVSIELSQEDAVDLLEIVRQSDATKVS